MTEATLSPDWKIKQQIVEDPSSGLTFQMEVMPDTSAPYRLRIFGEALPFGNREILFDKDGKKVGSGTFTGGLCKPTWTQELESDDH